jgi:IS5 family transposase
MKKDKYRVSNWKSYNKSLVKRGDLTLWFDEESLRTWHKTKVCKKTGRPFTYGNQAILCLSTIRSLLKLPLRATQGFGLSLIKMLGITDIKIPDYTTLCRRQKDVYLPRTNTIKGPVHLVFDSTGLKVFGEGEWKVRQHGISKRRTWRKLHLAIDEKSGEILASALSTNNVGDQEVLGDLLDQIDNPIKQASGDGAYDTHENYKMLEKLGAKITIPPRKGAVFSGNSFLRPILTARNRNIAATKILGKKRWKKISGYHRRSLAETAMMRFKTTFGSHLKARKIENQATEAFIKCNILNKITQIGKPVSYKI